MLSSSKEKFKQEYLDLIKAQVELEHTNILYKLCPRAKHLAQLGLISCLGPTQSHPHPKHQIPKILVLVFSLELQIILNANWYQYICTWTNNQHLPTPLTKGLNWVKYKLKTKENTRSGKVREFDKHARTRTHTHKVNGIVIHNQNNCFEL